MIACAWNASVSSSGHAGSVTRAPAACAILAAVSTAPCIAGLASPHTLVRAIAMRGAAGAAWSTRRSRPVIAAAANATSTTRAANSPAVSR